MRCFFHSDSGFFEKHPDFFEQGRSHSLFFLGIGGASVSSLARYALLCGFDVAGSDRASSDTTDALRAAGIRVYIGHRKDNLPVTTDLLIYSLAVTPDAPEYAEAVRRGIPTVSRAEFLGGLMARYENRVGVSGSHGKSTVTAMIAKIFTDAGADPTVFSGAGLSGTLPSYRFGGRKTMIYEACEYRDSFLCFSPTAAVALNLELDHTDYFPDLAAIQASFRKSLLGAGRLALVSADDPNLSAISSELPREKRRTFGFSGAADYRVTDSARASFSIAAYGEPLGRFSLAVPGRFQITNAAAAIAAACEHGIPVSVIRDSLAGFSGIPRRMQLLGSFSGEPVYYDYAHHPTEIASVIELLHEAGKRVSVVFRPHTFSRTGALWREFAAALSLAEFVILLPVDPIREEPIAGITSDRLAAEIGARASFLPLEEISALPALLRDRHAAILLLGAADLREARGALCADPDFRERCEK